MYHWAAAPNVVISITNRIEYEGRNVVRFMRIQQDNGVFDSNEASEGGLFGMRFVIVNGKEPVDMWKTVALRMLTRPRNPVLFSLAHQAH